MSWQIVQACSTGTSHLLCGQSCQDNCLALEFITSTGKSYFIGLVADGAGSASEGKRGSDNACEKAIEIIKDFLDGIDLVELNENVLIGWGNQINAYMKDLANQEMKNPRDFACTFLGVIIGDTGAGFFQIGDGAIVVSEGDGYIPVFWPESGEYANMTHFITDDDALEHLNVKVQVIPPNEVAIFSDGLQRIALVHKTRSVHVPFFEPMFKVIRAVSDDMACDVLSDRLKEFLDSSQVNERTDDDKTLVLATYKLP